MAAKKKSSRSGGSTKGKTGKTESRRRKPGGGGTTDPGAVKARTSGKKGGHQKKHLAGVSDKEQRMYEHIKEDAQKSGRYGKRAKEVAARTVMKTHAKKGHARGK
jgi:hypothetical protein